MEKEYKNKIQKLYNMEKEYKNKIQKIYNILWRKIDSNYHICSASTTDYHYQIPPF